MSNLVYKYRIKDSGVKKRLEAMASAVNFVWNYCNEISQEHWERQRKFISYYELCDLTKGAGKELGLHSQTIQRICDEFTTKRKQHKKIRLSWRSAKRKLPWIPISKQAFKFDPVTGNVKFFGKIFKTWYSRKIPNEAVVVDGSSFVRDSTGKWFFNLSLKIPNKNKNLTNPNVGIDLGLKSQLTLSDGTIFQRENLTQKFANKVAMTQKAKKKKQTAKLHKKIKNIRKDWNHKVTTKITNNYSNIYIGNVSSKRLTKTKLAKSVYDASWGELKQMLVYKASKLGNCCQIVNESYSTVTCADCFAKSGPHGLSSLGVREWICERCGCVHDRDINAARNILRFGHETLIKGVLAR